MSYMSVYIFALWTLCMCGCQESVDRVLGDQKLKEDSENVLEDIFDIVEDVVEDGTGLDVEINLPKEKKHAVKEGK